MYKTYLTREGSIKALKCMKSFHDECKDLYSKHGFNLLDNLGRRNIVLSQAQEKYFADVIAEMHAGVVNDGRTGQPDIMIKSLGKELECKLTSRHKGGAISLQSDYTTLSQKGTLDYLYVIADENFESFAVLHFKDLSVEDFRPLSNGSRGKVAMYKHKGMEKCSVLVGEAVSVNEINIEKLQKKLLDPTLPAYKRQSAQKSLAYWKEKPTSYSFKLEKLNEN